jgi:hypothetical protein
MRDASPEAMLQACNAVMQDWCKGAPAADDRTAVILKRLA